MAFEDDAPRSAGSTAPPMAGGGSGWGADPDMPPGSPREKFRRDSPERRDRFGRDIRGRSRSPGDSRMARRRSRSPGRRPSIPDEGDRYIPQYDRERERDSGGDRRYGNRGYGGRGGRMSGRDGDSDMSGGDMMGRAGGLPDPQTYDQVVPFKYYAEWLRSTDGNRRMEQDEVRERYEEYRRKALQRLYTQFFNAHKEDDWFSERFEPERRKEYIQKLAAVKSENLSRFMADMDSGKLDNVTHTASTEQVMQHEINRRDQSSSSTLGSNGDGDGSSDEMAVAHTLFIRTVPPSVPRAALEGELRKQPGFVYLVLSEPRQDKQYHRFGWVRFENGTDMEKTLDGLGGVNIDQFQFHFSRHTNNSAAGMRLTPDVASSEERIRHDLRLVREAVKSLDERTDPEVFHSLALLQKKARDLSAAAGELSAPDGGADADDRTLPVGEEEGEDGDVTMTSRDRAPGSPADKDAFGDEGDARLSLEAARRELDLLLEYLRRVHYYCYYCGHTADSSEDFARRCAKLHLRRALTSSRGPQPSGSWTRTLDNRNDVIVRPLDPERLLKEGGKSLERETDAELDSQFQQQDEGRFRCSICNKLFKGDAFVRKHIRNKHPEVVPDTLVHEITFFNNFVREAPHFVQIGTGGALGALGGGMMGGGGMRDRGAGYMPQMMPGMMMPGMMPYMMPGMVPGMMPGMMPMGNPYMMGMMGGDRGQAMYGQAFNGRPAAGRAPGGGHSDPRAVRSYVDLDAPAEGEADFGF